MGEAKSNIEVETIAEGKFRVRVMEGNGETFHQVTLDAQYHQQLTGGKTAPEELVKRSFEFLLRREPKESILAKFDLRAISRYFPEYETEIKIACGA